jgi:hypothetical protein
MAFCGSSAGSKFIEAIDLGIDIGDIAAGQITFRFKRCHYLYLPRKEKNDVSALPSARRNADI